MTHWLIPGTLTLGLAHKNEIANLFKLTVTKSKCIEYEKKTKKITNKNLFLFFFLNFYVKKTQFKFNLNCKCKYGEI